MLKKGFVCLLAAVMMLSGVLSGCSGDKTKKDAANVTYQFEKPKAGDEIAKITVKDFGEITARFFEDAAPKAVKNFKQLAKDGAYDGVTFHRVIEDFMIQGGGDGDSIYGGGFEIEIDARLHNFTGALCMARTGDPKAGQSRQFYIVQTSDLSKYDAFFWQQTEAVTGSAIAQTVKDKYAEIGGSPHLDGQYTVFGQVLSGQDVVDEIAKTQVDGNDQPLDSVVIEKIEILKYQE